MAAAILTLEAIRDDQRPGEGGHTCVYSHIEETGTVFVGGQQTDTEHHCNRA